MPQLGRVQWTIIGTASREIDGERWIMVVGVEGAYCVLLVGQQDTVLMAYMLVMIMTKYEDFLDLSSQARHRLQPSQGDIA